MLPFPQALLIIVAGAWLLSELGFESYYLCPFVAGLLNLAWYLQVSLCYRVLKFLSFFFFFSWILFSYMDSLKFIYSSVKEHLAAFPSQILWIKLPHTQVLARSLVVAGVVCRWICNGFVVSLWCHCAGAIYFFDFFLTFFFLYLNFPSSLIYFFEKGPSLGLVVCCLPRLVGQ